MPVPLDRPTIFPLLLLAVVFMSLGFIQIVFQQGIQKAVEQTLQTQRIMNQTLGNISVAAPQSNFSAQKVAIEKIDNIEQDVRDIKRVLNVT